MTTLEMIAFSDVVTDAYTVHELSVLLLGLDRNLHDFTSPNASFSTQVREIVQVANRTGWISQLVLNVIKDRPNLPSVKDFLTKYPHWNQ